MAGVEAIPDLASAIRRVVLQQSKRANVGHIGSALSIADILAVLYGGVLRVDGSDRATHDRFVLSKGHAALAAYAALELTGRLPAGTCETYCESETTLGVHPEHTTQGVDFSTGSLGQGLPMAVGAALAARMKGTDRRVFVVMSDAELNEGSTWEAAMLAAQHRLSNLVLIVDMNGQQALGYTKDVLDLDPVADRWSSFRWAPVEVDGHDVEQMRREIESLDTTAPGPPHVLLADTTFGSGVSYMESRIEWHYLPMNDQEYEIAMGEQA